MNQAHPGKAVLRQLHSALREVERLDATIAAAHLDAAIEALCRHTGLPRSTSEMERE